MPPKKQQSKSKSPEKTVVAKPKQVQVRATRSKSVKPVAATQPIKPKASAPVCKNKSASQSKPKEQIQKISQKKQEVILHDKDTLISIVEVTEDRQFVQLSVCKIMADWKQSQAKALVSVLNMVKPLQFELSKRRITIDQFQVLCAVEAKEKAGLWVITQAYKKQMAKLFDENSESVKEKLGIKTESSSGSDAQQSESSESEDSEASVQSKSDVEMVAPRKIVRVQRKLAPAKATKETKKKPRAATVSPVKSDPADSSPKVVGKKRRAVQKLNEVVPSPKGRKAKRISTDARKDVKKEVKSDLGESDLPPRGVPKKAKKPPKQPIEFKLGKWNPTTEIVDKEIEKMDDSEEAVYNCCLKCNTRNVIRAIKTNNKFLLRKLMYDDKNIPNLCQPWSKQCPMRPLQIIANQNNFELMREFCEVAIDKDQAGDYQIRRHLTNFFVSRRPSVKQYLLAKIDTGHVSKQAYGTHIRKVEIARGNRQGNNAFMDELQGDQGMIPDIFKGHAKWDVFRTITVSFFKAFTMTTLGQVSDLKPDGDDGICARIAEIARTGNRDFVEFLVGPCIKFENFGFNQLHHDALKLNQLTEKYHTASITKKCFSNKNITPLHFAAINPNEQVIDTLLNQNPEYNVTDDQLWKPIHYAAACTGSGPLRILLQKGANLSDLTNLKFTPLHIAAQTGRAENITLILKEKPSLVKARDKKKNSAMAYALDLGEIEPILAFLNSKAVKINQGQGIDRMTCLHYAAAQGNYDMCRILLDSKPKARVMSKDKFKRIALTMAVKNGHVKVASLLLQEGSDWNHPDSSGNTPLHYAAGYGWQECIQLLLKHGALINAENSWRVTPITIAMLKNHQGIVKNFLKLETVDVNGKDDKGRTFLTIALVDLTDDEVVEFVKFLIDKGANVNTQDLDGNTPLHLLAVYNSQLNHQEKQISAKVDAENLNLTRVIKLLLENGANMSQKNKAEKTPFSLALLGNKINILDMFTDSVKLSEDVMLLHSFKTQIFDERYLSILYKLLARDQANLADKDFNVLDPQGFNVFLAYIQSWTQQYNSIFSRVETEVQNQYKIHKKEFQKYAFTQKELNDPFRNQFVNDNYFKDGLSAFGNQNNNSYHLEVDAKMRKKLCRKFIILLFEQPFVQLLKYLVSHGANPLAKVEKLQYYRQLDEQREKILNSNFEDEAVNKSIEADVMMIDTSNQLHNEAQKTAKVEDVKTRIETIAEQKFVDSVLRRNQMKGRLTKEQRQQLKEKVLKRLSEVKEEIRKNCSSYFPKFKQVDGKQVEIEYCETNGLRNSVHLLMDNATKLVFNYIVDDLKVPVDELSYSGLTPFYVKVKNQISKMGMDKLLGTCLEQLIQLGVNIDCKDHQGQTPFLLLYSNQNAFCQQAAEYLRQKGANVNQVSKSGMFALKIALIRRKNEEITRLVGVGADINQVDNNGRNLLHEAINMSSAGADATFETEQLLIDLGIEINQTDHFGRVPLHYAFVKIEDRPETRELNQPLIQNYSGQTQFGGGMFGGGGFGFNQRSHFGHAPAQISMNSEIDPIETVSSLCAQKELKIDVVDKWLKSPLHYAAARSSTISTLYILQRGAKIEGLDIYGNTALGIALMNKHINYGIILIQKGANVKVPIFNEFPKKIAKQFRLEKKLKEIQDLNQNQLAAIQANADVEMKADDKTKEDKSHRKLFFQKQKFTSLFPWLGGFLDSDSEADIEHSSDDSEGSEMEIDVFNNQNAFGAQFINPNERKRLKKLTKKIIDEENEVVEPEQEPKSTFKLSIEHGQQGIAYLILDNGYNYMLAMNDALDDGKLQLVLTLLAKTADDAIIQRKNEKGQNLMHILALNSKRCGQNQTVFDNMMRICHILRKRGVNCLEQDNLGNNALHYAVQNDSYQLVQVLISEKIDVNAVNKEGHSPFSLYCIKNRSSNGLINLSFTDVFSLTAKTILDMILDAGANVNFVFPFQLPLTVTEMLEARLSSQGKSKPKEIEHKTTILINSARYADQRIGGVKSKDFRQIQFLIRKGSRFDVLDSDAHDAIHYAILNNDTELVKMIETLHDKNGLVVDLKDALGNTAVYYCVQPTDFGSYENVEILESLHKLGYNLNAKNKMKITALDLSLNQSSGKMGDKLIQLMHKQLDPDQRTKRRKNSLPENYPQSKFDYNFDSQQLLDQAEAKKAIELVQKGKEPAYVPIDVAIKNPLQYEVYYNADAKPYDCYLTKVDLKNGLYGAYVFYKMQLLRDTVRDLYLLLTRYGRIGEQGACQQTPFTKIEDAIQEYQTVFKQKTSNEWTAALTDEFVKAKKKYNLVEVHYSNVEHKDYLAPFDFDNCKPAQGVCQKVIDFLETICNVTMYQRAIDQSNVDIKSLPISSLKRQTLQKAHDILSEIQDVITNEVPKLKDQRRSFEMVEADYEANQKLGERLSKLSSQFFELIPMKEQRNQITQVIYDQHTLNTHFAMINLLKNVERVSRLLLAALYRQMQINPIQYIYEHLGTHIIAMDELDPEMKLIQKLVCNTSQARSFNSLKIFKVWRQDEVEEFKKFETLKNRQLLFHGSSISNYLGILSQGLQIAPDNVPVAGASFGKGIYFADMFAKSDAYSNNSRMNVQVGFVPNIMLLCEVALGEIKKVIYSDNFTKESLTSGFNAYNSIRAYGRRGPDHKHARIVTPQGFGVTASAPVESPNIQQHELDKFHISEAQKQNLMSYTYNRPNISAQGASIYQVEYNEYVVFNPAQVKIRYLLQYK